jgi:hypothetical protein
MAQSISYIELCAGTRGFSASAEPFLSDTITLCLTTKISPSNDFRRHQSSGTLRTPYQCIAFSHAGVVYGAAENLCGFRIDELPAVLSGRHHLLT